MNTYIRHIRTHRYNGGLSPPQANTRVSTKEIQSGPTSRRGRKVINRGRCVCCYVNAPNVPTGMRKTKMEDGKNIPVVTYVCL